MLVPRLIEDVENDSQELIVMRSIQEASNRKELSSVVTNANCHVPRNKLTRIKEEFLKGLIIQE